MQIKNRINWSIVGVLYFSLFLTSCSEEQTIIQRCNNFDKSDTEFFQNSELKIGRKLILETTEEFGEINSNIPPKIMGSRLFLITDKNVILSYDLSRKGIIKPASVTSLPNIYEVVSDFIVENDSIVSFCSNLGIYSISEYNRHSKKVKLFHTDTTMCHSMPFLGLSLRKFDDKFLFPQVPVVSANNEGNFLSIYNKNKRHEYAIGNLLPHGETRFAPFFDAFLMSEITNNIFYVSSTSSNGVAKCRLKWENNKWTIQYLETLSFSKQLFNHFQGRMKESDLGDFAAMELAAISHPYGLGIHDCGNRLIRITKKEQPFMNKKTSTKNIMMNAPWTMEILNLKSKKGEIHEIAAGQFRFTNAFVHKNQLFVLSNQSNQHEIIYYSLR